MRFNQNIPDCFQDQLRTGSIASLYSYTFGEDELVYLVTFTETMDKGSTLFDANCEPICDYEMDTNTWQHPCASFPQRSDNETRLYPNPLD
ncbi:hypothetical protein [Maribacter sp. 2307ULW6-5]|uniref:hypothetical protein n=1 Tax=Maribacter sp. 2307ULW6-5 TaxID=3386275 RepID=UPI0039BC743D